MALQLVQTQPVFVQPSGPATPNNITLATIGALLYPVLAIEGTTVVNGQYPYGLVDRYGTNSQPGTTVMLPAIAAAFAQATQPGGYPVQFMPGMQYFVGTISGLGTMLTVTGLTNSSILGNGAIITSNTTFTNTLAVPVIFNFVNAENVTIDNLGCLDTGYDVTQSWKGPSLFTFSMSDANDRKRITIQNCKFKNVVTPIVFTSSGGGTGRYRGINISGCVGDSCFYGPSFQEMGDEAEIDFTTINAVRSYFPYGVSGHNANIHVWHDATSQGANACIDIKRYANDTRNIRLRADFHGYTSQYGSLVNLETQMTVGTASITQLGAITEGTGGTSGTYYGVPLTGGSGLNASANVTVFSGSVVRVDLADRGTGYASTDTLSASAANIGGTTGFSIAVSAVGAVIDGVDIDLHFEDAQQAVGIAVPSPVQFRSYTQGGVQNNTTTDLWDRISLKGNMGQGTLQPITIASVMTGTLGRLTIDPASFDMSPNVPAASAQDYPGFIVKTANNVEFYTLQGNLTAAPLGIDLSGYLGRFFSLILDVEAESDYSFASNQTTQSFVVIGFVSFSLTVSFGSTAIYAAQVSGGTSAVPTIGSSGSKITVSFSNYNGANARARVTARHLSRLR